MGGLWRGKNLWTWRGFWELDDSDETFRRNSGKDFYRLLYADIQPMKWMKWMKRGTFWSVIQSHLGPLMKATSNNSGQNALEWTAINQFNYIWGSSSTSTKTKSQYFCQNALEWTSINHSSPMEWIRYLCWFFIITITITIIPVKENWKHIYIYFIFIIVIIDEIDVQ